MYTLEEIAALRQKCETLHLEGREILDNYSDAEWDAFVASNNGQLDYT